MKKIINRFTSSLVMASRLFELYQEKASSDDLKKLISISENSLEKLINELNSLNQDYNKEPNKSLMCGQIMAIKSEKFNLKFIESDAKLILRIIKSVNTGQRASIKILYKNKNLIDNKVKEKLLSVIKELQKIESYYNDYANTII